MVGRLRKATMAVAGVLAAAGLFGAGAARAADVRQAGPFEITAHRQRVGDSGAFLRSGNPFRTEQVRHYEVRWNGRPVEVPSVGRRFWQVLHLPQARRPALVLINGPRVHLVVDTVDRLDTRPLAPESGSYALQWLDDASGQPSPPLASLGLDRIADTPNTTLDAGRWLYVNRRLVLDTHALTIVAVEPWLRLGQGETVVEINASTTDAIALSPDRTRFILPAEGQDYARDGERFDALMLIDMATGKPDLLRLDRVRTPYGHLLEIDAAWIAAHWRWAPTAGGPEGLVAR
jgi:hypothetical protein